MIKTTFVGLLFFGTLVVSCGSKEEVKKENTVPNVQPQKVGELKIAFYDQDSLKESFNSLGSLLPFNCILSTQTNRWKCIFPCVIPLSIIQT